jgi:hypothetical protein
MVYLRHRIMFYGLQISIYLQSTRLFTNITVGSPYNICTVCIHTHTNTHFIFVYPENLIVILINSHVDDIYQLICNLILNLAVVLGTIFIRKPLISTEPTEAADPELKAAVNMTPNSPTVRDPDPAPDPLPSSSLPYNLGPYDP